MGPTDVFVSNNTIIFGDNNRNEPSSSYRQEVRFRLVYLGTGRFFDDDDLYIFQFENPVEITDYVRPICFTKVMNEAEEFDNCWIAGWGRYKAG